MQYIPALAGMTVQTHHSGSQTESQSILCPGPALLDSSFRWNDDGVFFEFYAIPAYLPQASLTCLIDIEPAHPFHLHDIKC